MQIFELHRDHDVTGTSGTGIVAQGVVFDDGTCALRWLSDHTSTAIYASLADVEAIHGHNGATRVVMTDDQWVSLGPADEPAPPIDPTVYRNQGNAAPLGTYHGVPVYTDPMYGAGD